MFARDLLRLLRPVFAEVADAAGRPEFGSEAAVRLVVGTAAAESSFAALYQRPQGPALGLWQIEPATLDDIEQNFLRHRPQLEAAVMMWVAARPADLRLHLVSNLAVAALVARLIYWRSPLKLPRADDIAGQARIWKAAYNTAAGKGTPAHYEAAYRRLVLPHL
ncbi:MAG: hypothetical protein OHK0024_24240 [Thalassobaculales bacterium]